MKKLSLPLAAALALFTAGPAVADGVKLCFGSNINNIPLINMLNGVEKAILIKDGNNADRIKANNMVDPNNASGFWSTTIPTIVNLTTGCYTFYILTKLSPNNGSVPWICDSVSVGFGPPDMNGTPTTIISGSLGGIDSSAILIPAKPTTLPPVNVDGCPVD